MIGGKDNTPCPVSRSIFRHFNADRHHVIGFGDQAIQVWIALLDRIHHIHASDHPANHSVLPVQKRGIGKHDEKLRIGAVRMLRTRHANGAGRKRNIGKLCRQISAVRTAGACPSKCPATPFTKLHIAGLRHEPRNDAVKYNPVIGRVFSQ